MTTKQLKTQLEIPNFVRISQPLKGRRLKRSIKLKIMNFAKCATMIVLPIIGFVCLTNLMDVVSLLDANSKQVQAAQLTIVVIMYVYFALLMKLYDTITKKQKKDD